MKKKVLLVLSLIMIATSASFAAKYEKVQTPSELIEIINLYKKANYSDCYMQLSKYIAENEPNALAHYYFAMVNAQLGKPNVAIINYEKTLSLADPESNLGKYAAKGKACLESPTTCNETVKPSLNEQFIRYEKAGKLAEPVQAEYEKLKIEELMREMNRAKDINPQEFKEYRDFSSMNSQQMPSNDEIVNALRTLQRAGLGQAYNFSDLSILGASPMQNNQMYNILGGSVANPQLIQSMLTNNMSFGF